MSARVRNGHILTISRQEKNKVQYGHILTEIQAF
jgi:hypothetical protein